MSIASQLYGVSSSAERLLELTELPAEEEGEVLHSFDEIVMDDITFKYDDGIEEVLQHVNWTIKRGDFMALTGISGGGKTSLFQLLLGIYRPTKGRMLFRAGDLEVPASRGTRALFAYVPQGNTLFSGTLRDNLTMFTDSATDEEIQAAVDAACLTAVVEDIGYDAVLGERGVGLSEGQAQRVAVARALLTKAPILLLDEATSALDEKTEAKLLKNISKMRDKTCIIVTHRRAALDICDYTLHIEGGIENKVVNLILITIIVISAAFTGMTLYQNKMLEDVNEETIGKQQQALTDITNGIMNDIVDQSMDQTTELKAQMADEVFHNLAVRVGMMGEYAGKLFQDPSSVGREEYAAPDKAQDGQIVCQTILADGVNEEEIADRIGLAANMTDMMSTLFGASADTNSCFIGPARGISRLWRRKALSSRTWRWMLLPAI